VTAEGRSSSRRAGSSGPSVCDPFSGVIRILCDVVWCRAPDCEIWKLYGKLIVQNGIICKGSGCPKGEDAEPPEGCDWEPKVQQAARRRTPVTKKNEGALLVPSLVEGETLDWVRGLVKASTEVEWSHVVVNGKVEPEIWEELSSYGVRIHIVPRDNIEMLASVITHQIQNLDLVAAWDSEDARTVLATENIIKIGVTDKPVKGKGSYDTIVSINPTYTEVPYVALGVELPLVLTQKGRNQVRKEWEVTEEKLVVAITEDQDFISHLLKTLGSEYKIVVLNKPKSRSKRVIFDPEIHLGDQIAASDVVIYESSADCVPLEVISAGMNRIPVIATNIPFVDVEESSKQLYWPIEDLRDSEDLKNQVESAASFGVTHPIVEGFYKLSWSRGTQGGMGDRWDCLVEKLLEGAMTM
jgi:hypothetical protein